MHKWSIGVRLLAIAGLSYGVCRGLSAWLHSDSAFWNRIAHAAEVSVEQLPAMSTTGASVNTDLAMGAPHWYGLAVPHSGAPLDIYSTAGAAMAVIGFCLLITRIGLVRKILIPLCSAVRLSLSAYLVPVVI